MSVRNVNKNYTLMLFEYFNNIGHFHVPVKRFDYAILISKDIFAFPDLIQPNQYGKQHQEFSSSRKRFN